MTTTGRWFTNSRHPRHDIGDWQLWSVGSEVVSGPPRASKYHTVAELTRMKMAGLYEVRPGEPALPRAEDCPGYVADGGVAERVERIRASMGAGDATLR